MWMSAIAGTGVQKLFAGEAGDKVVAREPWGRIEKLHDGVWAIVSTPLDTRDFTTMSNGGIIAGSKRVLLVESFASAKGAGWAARQARELTGELRQLIERYREIFLTRHRPGGLEESAGRLGRVADLLDSHAEV